MVEKKLYNRKKTMILCDSIKALDVALRHIREPGTMSAVAK